MLRTFSVLPLATEISLLLPAPQVIGCRVGKLNRAAIGHNQAGERNSGIAGGASQSRGSIDLQTQPNCSLSKFPGPSRKRRSAHQAGARSHRWCPRQIPPPRRSGWLEN